MSGARHCPSCDVYWPLGNVKCPACYVPTALTATRQPNRTRYHAYEADFERRYALREEQRVAEGHLAPEAIGKREAKAIIELERSMEGAA
jgi:hypothetical protein